MKRSEFKAAYIKYGWSENGAEEVANIAESAMHFDPEEPDAVEAWEEEKDRSYGSDIVRAYNELERAGDKMCDELQAKIMKRDLLINDQQKAIISQQAELSHEREAREKTEAEIKNIMDYGGFDLLKRENANLKKRIEEVSFPDKVKNAVISNFEQAPESPELVEARDEFREMRARYSQRQCTDWSMVNKSMIYIAALEAERGKK